MSSKKPVDLTEDYIDIELAVRRTFNKALEDCISTKDQEKCFENVMSDIQKAVRKLEKEVGISDGNTENK